MLFVYYLILVACVALATTTPSNIRMGVTYIDGTGTHNNLAHPTPVVAITQAGGTTIINGLSSAGASNGEVVVIVRMGDGGTFTVNSDSPSAVASERIILPNGRSLYTTTARGSIQLVYFNAWYVISVAM